MGICRCKLLNPVTLIFSPRHFANSKVAVYKWGRLYASVSRVSLSHWFLVCYSGSRI